MGEERKLLSIRKYAEHVGVCTHVYLAKLIKEGKFPREALVNGQIDVALADRLWAAGYVKMKEGKVLEKGEESARGKKATPPSAKGRQAEKEELRPLSPKEEGERIRKEMGVALVPEARKPIRNEDVFSSIGGQGEDMEVDSEWDGGEIPTDISYAEALRVERILKAKQVQQEIDIKNKVLVERTLVDAELIRAGMEIRKMLEQQPKRMIDAILGAKGRNEALKLWEDDIERMLREMAERGVGDAL